ncbi:tenascin-X [Nephila pilipes]|uniref:Tenascin-X n=1 Tax=Nephila pilipes TaxID=299642 RepID=A0A8X6TWD8_NEPPI|nr:tenascin-X [Nephila pilipes]
MNKITKRLPPFVCLFLILLNTYTSEALTDNLEEGSIDDSFLKDLKSDIISLVVQESDLQKAVTQCNNDADCYNAGKCTRTKDGLRVCECISGTSGPLCKDVDECINNPYRCGNGTDVQCLFDLVREKAFCKCDNTSKEFDHFEKICRVPCPEDTECEPNGRCVKDRKSRLSVSFCRCKSGASGDWCQIIDQCESKEMDCGSDIGVTCALGKNGEAYCECENTKQSFDYDDKVCKDCNCGNKSYSCKFENGTKICDCKPAYQQRIDECALCDCGYFYTLNCSFNATGEKICGCKPGAIQSKKGECITQCDDNKYKCSNGGTCDKITKMCHCPKGTSGDFCSDIDWCEDVRCGGWYEVLCVYNPETTMGECKCREENHVYDDKAKNCFEWHCGPFGSCTYENGSKICKCPEGYSLYDSKCGKCDCGKTESRACTLGYGSKKCHCKKNYAPKTGYFLDDGGRDTRCVYCNCGDHGECSFDGDKKRCDCDEHYLEYSGRCEECFCGNYGTCKLRNGEKVCTCDYDYAVRNGICVPCTCDPPGLRGIGAKCSFEDGVKYCKCPEGFVNEYGICEDIDECARGSCPSSTNCVNVPGSYECECKTGYELAREDDNPKFDGCKETQWRAATIALAVIMVSLSIIATRQILKKAS